MALILSAELQPPVQALFEALRRQYFPPERNWIPAHISLFHALPDAEYERIGNDIRELLPRNTAFEAAIRAPVSIGRGVAYFLDAPLLQQTRTELARRWSNWLIPQDRQGYRPHIVVQNKVDSTVVAQTLKALAHTLVPAQTSLAVLRLWRYENGPWAHLCDFPLWTKSELP